MLEIAFFLRRHRGKNFRKDQNLLLMWNKFVPSIQDKVSLSGSSLGKGSFSQKAEFSRPLLDYFSEMVDSRPRNGR